MKLRICKGHLTVIALLCAMLSMTYTNASADNTLQIASFTSEPGGQYVMPVNLLNSADITSIQFDLDLPSEVTVAESGGELLVDLNTSRTTTRKHYVEATKNADGTIHVECVSTRFAAFSGNEGPVVDVTLNISSSAQAGSYKITVKNAILTDTDGEKYNADDATANAVVVDGVDLSPLANKIATLQEEYSSLAAKSQLLAASVSEIAAITQNLKDQITTLSAKRLTEADLATLQDAQSSLSESENALANCQQELQQVQQAINSISNKVLALQDEYAQLNEQNNLAKSKSGTERKQLEEQIRQQLSLAIENANAVLDSITSANASLDSIQQGCEQLKNSLAEIQTSLATILPIEPSADNTLAIDGITSEAGKTMQQTMSVSLINKESITSLQFDLVLPAGVSVAEEDGEMKVDLNESRTNQRKHSVSAISNSDGSVHIECVSMTNAAFTGNEGPIIDVALDIAGTIASGDYAITLKEILLTATDGTQYSSADATAMLSVVDGVDISPLATKLSALAEQNNALTSEHNDLASKIQALASLIEAQENQVQTLSAKQLADADKTLLNNAKTELEANKSALNDCQQQMLQIANQLSDIVAQIDALQAQYAELQQQNEQAKQLSGNERRQLEEQIRNNLSSALSSASETESSINALMSNQDVIAQSCENLQISIANVQSTLDAIRPIEPSTDNVLVADNITCEAGNATQYVMSVGLSNKESITTVQFDIQLPSGVTVAEEDGELKIDLNEERTTMRKHSVTTIRNSDGSIHVECVSMSNAAFSGNTGKIVDATLNIAAMSAGDYPILLNNILLTATDGTQYSSADATAMLTVVDGVDITPLANKISSIAEKLAATSATEWELACQMDSLSAQIEAQESFAEELAGKRLNEKDKARLQDANEKMEQYKVAFTELQARLQQAETQISNLTSVLADIQNEYIALQMMCEELKQKSGNERKQYEELIRAGYNQEMAQADNLETSLIETTESLIPMQSDIEELQASVIDVQDILEAIRPIEMSEDNILTIDDVEDLPGNQETIHIILKNTDNITAFQCDLYLPESINIAEEDGEMMINLNEERTSLRKHSVSYAKQKDGAIRIVCTSMSNAIFSGEEGPVIDIVLDTIKTACQDTLWLKNIELTTPEAKQYMSEDAEAILNIFMVGDANGDSRVDVADITTTAAYILGKNPILFVPQAADANQDGVIDVADITTIAKFILSK